MFEAITGIFQELSYQSFIRLVMIVGGYILFRPYLVKLGAKIQERHYNKMNKDQQLQTATDIQTGSSKTEEEEDNSKSEFGWGKRTRKNVLRQRKIFETQARRQAEMAQDDDSDAEIEELLIHDK